MADRISLDPGNESTLNLRTGSDSGSAGMLGGGFIGGAILGGGAGYILSREVGDMKGRMGDLAAEIKGSQSSIEKEIAGVTFNLKDQICATEKLVSAEAQRTNGIVGAVNDVMQGKFAAQNELINALSRDTERSIAAAIGSQKDCCCALEKQLAELQCCCSRTGDKIEALGKDLGNQIDCFQTDINNKFIIQAKDQEIQRLKDQAYNDRRFDILEKGQQEILCKLNQDRAIDAAKSEAVKAFQTEQLFNKMNQILCGNNPK